MVRLAIDIGGTFTDVVAETPKGLTSIKVLTSASAPEVAALEGADNVLQQLGSAWTDVSGIVHGTTLATNALIERRGAKTALITTAGFRDVLEMQNEKRFDQYALNIELPKPLVPRPLRFTIEERMLVDGSVLKAPSLERIESLLKIIQAQGVEAVAIGLLHAYKNPAHENLIAEYLQQRLDSNVTVCQSAQLAAEIREYERFSTVCANAYIRPLMTRYLNRLSGQLTGRGFNGSFLMMLSDGALTTLEHASRYPIRLVEGGPSGGVAFAAHVATQLGSKKTLSLDIGGTTAKICFIENGKPQKTRRFEVARCWRDIKGSGLPIKVPAVELVEIGAGGGSIAKVDDLKRLKIGPRSSGSNPGPVAYNLGGTEATVTDAHLTLGNIDANGFANGIIILKPQLSPKAIDEQVRLPLDLPSAEHAAAGIIELADETMANAARVHGIELGLDISRFDLLVSGGGGGLHAIRIAEKLGIQRIFVPSNAGVGSAVGFLRSPVAFEIAISIAEVLSCVELSALSVRIKDAITKARSVVTDAIPSDETETIVKAELRYLGQGLEIMLPLQHELALEQALPELEKSFIHRYTQLTGFSLKDIAVELVSVSVLAQQKRHEQDNIESIVFDSQTPTHISACDSSTASSSIETSQARREIFELTTVKRQSYAVNQRDTLNGDTIDGPTVIPEAQTTTLVRAGWSVTPSPTGHLILQRVKP